jgi:serine/threonine protein phosphatase 1
MRNIIISDIHGHAKKLKELLTLCNYTVGQDQLIFLGDYINRGPDSLGVVKIVKNYVTNENAIALLGNHEEMFLDFLSSKNRDYDFNFLENVGGDVTLESFCDHMPRPFDDIDKSKQEMKTVHKELIGFLKNLPRYYEDERHIYVHAGVYPFDWKQTEPEDFIWMGSEFYMNETYLDKKVIFGHTPTSRIRENDDNSVWFDPKGDKIGIDGGCGFAEGQLNALIFDGKTYKCVNIGGENHN